MPRAQGQIITVGVTGASGALFAQKTLALLEEDARVARVHLVITETGQRLFAEELGLAGGVPTFRAAGGLGVYVQCDAGGVAGAPLGTVASGVAGGSVT